MGAVDSAWRSDRRESVAECARRCVALLRWVLGTGTGRAVVFSHGVLMEALVEAAARAGQTVTLVTPVAKGHTGHAFRDVLDVPEQRVRAGEGRRLVLGASCLPLLERTLLDPAFRPRCWPRHAELQPIN